MNKEEKTEQNKDYLVSGETKSGIAYTVDTRVRNDSRYLHLLVQMNNKRNSSVERANALFSMLGLLFGGNDSVMVFENEVAAHNEGVCTIEMLIAEVKEILDVANLKN